MARIIPLAGPDTHRYAAAANGVIKDNELHATSDQHRLFLENYHVGAVYHGEVASEAAMIALTDAARGCWPGDLAWRTDVNGGTLFVCVSNNGQAAGDWKPTARTSAIASDEVTYDNTASGLAAADVKAALDELADGVATAIAGNGETNTGTNVGDTGTGLFIDKSGVSLRFRKIVAGSNVTVTQLAGGELEISSSSGGGAGTLETYENVLNSYTGLVHRWKFNEASGNFADSVGTLTFSPVGSMTYQQPGPMGGTSAARFGSGVYLQTSGLGSVPTGANARTFVAILRNPNPSTGVLGGYGTTSTRQWFTPYLHANGISLTCWSDDLSTYETPICDAKWHVVAFGYDGVKTTFAYIDGQIKGRGLSDVLNTPSSGNFYVNYQTGVGGTDWSNGELDDFAIFSTYLSKAQLDALYMAVNQLPDFA